MNHDLSAADYRQMRTPAFRKWTYHYKNTEEGKEKMDEAMERYASRREQRGLAMGLKRGSNERAVAVAKMMLAMGDSLEKVVKCVGLSRPEVEKINEELTKEPVIQ